MACAKYLIALKEMINILSHNIFIALGGKLEHLFEFRGALSFLRLLIASSLQWMQTGFSMNII